VSSSIVPRLYTGYAIGGIGLSGHNHIGYVLL